MATRRELRDDQWDRIKGIVPGKEGDAGRRGEDNRLFVDAVLWIMRSGAPWRFLPDEFPSPSTCWRRLKQWEEQGVWLDAWRALLGALDGEGLLMWYRAIVDNSFAAEQDAATPAVKPVTTQARSGWYKSAVKVFCWEFGWKVPLR